MLRILKKFVVLPKFHFLDNLTNAQISKCNKKKAFVKRKYWSAFFTDASQAFDKV